VCVCSRGFCCLIEVTMPLICAAKAEEKIPAVSSNGSRNELALIRGFITSIHSTKYTADGRKEKKKIER